MASSSNFSRDPLFDLKGLVTVITGGGSGIGRLAAKTFAQNGATVYVLGRRLDMLHETVSLCEGLGGKVIALQCDTTSKQSLQEAASTVEKEVGYVNLLFANAGIQGPRSANLMKSMDRPLHEVQKELWDLDQADFLNTFQVNVVGTQWTTVAFLDLLDKGNQKGNVKHTSQVIITSSVAAYHSSWVVPSLSYCTSKAAINSLIKCLSGTLVKYKIRVNGLAPGLFPSEMAIQSSGMSKEEIVQDGKFSSHLIPMCRAGRDAELAGMLLYMASEAGGYNVGSIHVVDGGRLGVAPGASY